MSRHREGLRDTGKNLSREKKRRNGKGLHGRVLRGANGKRLISLRWKLTGFTFLLFFSSAILTVAIYIVLTRLLRSSSLVELLTEDTTLTAVILLSSCVLISIILFALLSRYFLTPIKQLVLATKEVRSGNFKVHIKTKAKPVSDLEELITNFNEMTRELDGIELFRNDFINNFSHEFKTPIVSIRGFARELQREGLSEEQKAQYARIIEEEADRLALLSTNVLELSKLENQQILTGKSHFYLDEQIRQSILLLEPEWSKKEIEILPELEELSFYSNEQMLSLVWNNLIGNAVKFTPKGGEIRVEMRVGEGEVTVLVIDNGQGMSEEVRAHIFEKFFQGDPSRAKRGNGIGLAVVKRVVTLCGGSVEVESEIGQGSTFRVTLPIESADEA